MIGYIFLWCAYLCPCGAEHSEFCFKKGAIQLQGQRIEVELALAPQEQSHGLMGRTELEGDHGMLFVYEEPQILSFWMKGTLIPLSIGFFDRNHRLINIEEMSVPVSTFFPQYTSKKKAMYALEMPSGWFKEHGIEEGAILNLEIPSF